MLNNYLVRSRLIVLAILPVIIFMITAIFSINTMGGLVKGIDDLYNNRVVPLKQIKTVSDNYAVNIVDLFHKFWAGTVTQAALLSAVEKAKNTADKEWENYLSTELTNKEKGLTATVEQKLAPVQQHLENLLSQIRNGTFDSLSQQQFVTDLYSVFDPLSASYQALIDLQLEEANQFKNQADENFALIS
ncbi:MCP four helix bundle domain-containing protein [Pseudoalteromonas sp.]|uniref:MCP four helix bundle domain-containing protein n=1 Tax=Pseudoalteromonas sp. TaxID=53249 RepID=UPI0030014207